jgi:hypothetical protein
LKRHFVAIQSFSVGKERIVGIGYVHIWCILLYWSKGRIQKVWLRGVKENDLLVANGLNEYVVVRIVVTRADGSSGPNQTKYSSYTPFDSLYFDTFRVRLCHLKEKEYPLNLAVLNTVAWTVLSPVPGSALWTEKTACGGPQLMDPCSRELYELISTFSRHKLVTYTKVAQ